MTIRWTIGVALLLAAQAAQAERINIAAIVNDDIITTNDVAERRDLIMLTNGIPPTLENQKRLEPRVIGTLIDETLQLQEAKRLSIKISPAEIDDAMANLEKNRQQEPGAVRAMLQANGLPERSLEGQLRAQLAWNKVVQRKLRRAVSISTDEVARAQAAKAAAPGEEEVRIAAISLLMPKPEDEERQGKLAAELAQRLSAGEDIAMIAAELAGREDVHINPPVWVTEQSLQPAIGQAVRGLRPGEVTPPLKSMNTFQLVKLFERRVSKPLPDATEVAVKEISFAMPKEQNEKTMAALRDAAAAVRANPGNCMDTALGVEQPAAQVRFLRATLGTMSPQMRSVISHMGVTEISEPMATPEVVRLFMLCERIEPASGALPPAEEVRQELFAEKVELESQKHLRNLKREAFIEVKGGGE